MTERWRTAPPGLCSPPTAPPSILLLAGELQSAKSARTFAREYARYHFPGVSDDYVATVTLVTSELVTNAIRYGTGPGDYLRVKLDADDSRTRIEVQDPSPRPPERRPEYGDRDGDSGRGLFIVDALCPGAWGTSLALLGKIVWAEVKR